MLHQRAIAAFSEDNYILAKQLLMLAELPLQHNLRQASQISNCFYTLSLCYLGEENDQSALKALHKAIKYDSIN